MSESFFGPDFHVHFSNTAGATLLARWSYIARMHATQQDEHELADFLEMRSNFGLGCCFFDISPPCEEIEPVLPFLARVIHLYALDLGSGSCPEQSYLIEDRALCLSWLARVLLTLEILSAYTSVDMKVPLSEEEHRQITIHKLLIKARQNHTEAGLQMLFEIDRLCKIDAREARKQWPFPAFLDLLEDAYERKDDMKNLVRTIERHLRFEDDEEMYRTALELINEIEVS